MKKKKKFNWRRKNYYISKVSRPQIIYTKTYYFYKNK